ncbi:MAG: ubiquinol-cytochrome c reductase iron-sulfur subunit [Bryobacteraceae bacterium]|jgi:menaquinol-cytochrome c reductase iron-sulfur subunit
MERLGSDPAATPAGSSRRSFFEAVILGLGAVIGAGLGLPALAYLLAPPKSRQQGAWIEIGELDKFSAGAPIEVAFRRIRADAWKVVSEKDTAWVVKRADGGVTAFGPQCTHLGCAYHWDDGRQEFVCPCHSSLFRIDGSVISGPAPRPLDRYETKVEDGKLMLGRLRISSERQA